MSWMLEFLAAGGMAAVQRRTSADSGLGPEAAMTAAGSSQPRSQRHIHWRVSWRKWGGSVCPWLDSTSRIRGAAPGDSGKRL